MRYKDEDVRAVYKDYILEHINTLTIGEMARDLNVPRWAIISVMKEFNIKSLFRCINQEKNKYWSDISFINFKICLELASSIFTDPEDIYSLAIMEYCKLTKHDMSEAKLKFRQYYDTCIIPNLYIFKKEYGIAHLWYDSNIELLLLAIGDTGNYINTYRRVTHG